MAAPADGNQAEPIKPLPPDFTRTLQYAHTGSAAEIGQDLAQIGEYLQQQRQKNQRYGWIIVISGICLIISFPLLASPLSFLPLVISAGVLGFAVYQCSRSVVALRYRLGVCRQAITLVQRDLAPTDLQITLDLRHPCKQKQPVQSLPVQFSNMKRDFFADQWLDLQGEFLDGTQFALVATEFVVRKHGTKRGRSGKTKHKSKVKSKGIEVALVLHIPRKRYGAVDVLQQDAAEALQLPSPVALKSFKIKQNRLQIVTKLPSIDLPMNLVDQSDASQSATVDVLSHTIGSLFLGSYHILNLAHKLSKPTT